MTKTPYKITPTNESSLHYTIPTKQNPQPLQHFRSMTYQKSKIL